MALAIRVIGRDFLMLLASAFVVFAEVDGAAFEEGGFDLRGDMMDSKQLGTGFSGRNTSVLRNMFLD